MLKVGDEAPDFSAPTANGTTISLHSLRGKWVVLYFYPKAFTPGCTAETIRFRDNYEELKGLGAEVLGISVDDLETQCKFADRYQVTFPILSDSSRVISRSYDVLWPLLSRNKRFTFVIDGKGVVRAIFRHEFQVSKHLDNVRSFLQEQLHT